MRKRTACSRNCSQFTPHFQNTRETRHKRTASSGLHAWTRSLATSRLKRAPFISSVNMKSCGATKATPPPPHKHVRVSHTLPPLGFHAQGTVDRYARPHQRLDARCDPPGRIEGKASFEKDSDCQCAREARGTVAVVRTKRMDRTNKPRRLAGLSHKHYDDSSATQSVLV